MRKPPALFSGWGIEPHVRNPGDGLCHEGALRALQTCGLTGLVDVRTSIEPVVSPWTDDLVIGGGTVLPTAFMSRVGPGLRQAKRIFIFGSGCLSMEELIAKRLANQLDREPYKRAVVIGLRGPLSCKHYEAFFDKKERSIGDLSFIFAEPKPVTVEKKKAAFFIVENDGRDSRIKASFNGVSQCFKELARTLQAGGVTTTLCHSDRSAQFFDSCGLTQAMGQLRDFRDAQELALSVQSASMVVTERLHPAIMACCSGIPFLCIQTTSKMQDLRLLLEQCMGDRKVVSAMFAGTRDNIKHRMSLLSNNTELPELLVATSLGIKKKLLEAASQLFQMLTADNA